MDLINRWMNTWLKKQNEFPVTLPFVSKNRDLSCNHFLFWGLEKYSCLVVLENIKKRKKLNGKFSECNVVLNAKKPSTNHAPVLPEKEFFGKTRIYLYRTNRTNIKFITNQR